MNFLPFVFTFLLLLTLLTSFLFSSLMGTVRENKVICTHHKAYLALLSEQNKYLFNSKKEKTPGTGGNPQEEQEHSPDENDAEPRSENLGLEKSKLNIYQMIHGTDPLAHKTLEQITMRLMDSLYGEYEFYKNVKDAAHYIVKQMVKDKIESLEEVQLKNPKLDDIYYKMLKGTNTSYPALNEYVTIDKSNATIFFRYASKTVLRAAFGESCAKKVFDAEKKNWLKDKRKKVLKKEDLSNLIRGDHSCLLPLELVDALLNCQNVEKGSTQIYKEGGEKIRAVHVSSAG